MGFSYWAYRQYYASILRRIFTLLMISTSGTKIET